MVVEKKCTIPSKWTLPLIAALAALVLVLGIALIAGNSSNFKTISELNAEIDSLNADVQAKTEENRQLSEAVKEQESTIGRYMADQEKLNADHQALADEVAAREADIEKLAAENQALSDEKTEQKGMLLSLQKDLNREKAANKMYAADQEKLSADHQALVGEVAAREADIEKLTADNQSLSDEKTEQKGMLLSLQKALNREKAETKALEEEYAAREAEMEKANANAQTKETMYAILYQAVAEKDQEIEGLKNDILEKDGEIAHLQGEWQKEAAAAQGLSDTVADKENQIEKLNEENKLLADESAAYLNEIEGLKQAAADTAAENEKTLADMQAELQKQADENKLLADENAAHLNEIEGLKQAAADAAAEREKALADMQAELQKQADENKLLADENAAHLNAIEGLKQAAADAAAEKETAVAALQEELKQKEEEIASLKVDVAVEAGKVDALSSGADERLNQLIELTAQMGDKEKEIEALKGDVQNKAAEIEGLNARLAEKDAEIAALTGEAALLDEQIVLLSAGTDEQGKKILALTQESADKDAVIAENESAIAALIKESADKDAVIAENESAIAALTQEKADRDQSIESMTAELAEKNARIEALTQESADQAESILGLQEDVALLTDERTQQADQIALLQQEMLNKEEQIAALTAEAGAQAEEILAMTENKALLDAEILSLTEEAASKQAELEMMAAENADMMAETVRLSGEILAKDEEISAMNADYAAQLEMLMAEIDRQSGEVSQLQGSVADLTEEVSAMEEALAAAQKENAELKKENEKLRQEVKDNSTFTFDLGLKEMPENWNPHQEAGETAKQMVDWLTDALYTYDYNETRDGFVILPGMAAENPVDVTKEYVGEKWKIAKGETGRAWKISLRKDLKWQDGTAITAKDFVSSYQLLADPVLKNTKAEMLWNGAVVISGAQDYYSQKDVQFISLRQAMAQEGIADIAAFLKAHGQESAYIDWGYSFDDTYDFGARQWKGTAERLIAKTPVTLAEFYEFYTQGEGARKITWADEAGRKEYVLNEVYLSAQMPEVKWEQVGVKTWSDYTLILILAAPADEYAVKEALTEKMLVQEKMYRTSMKQESSIYATSEKTTFSCGPYMLVSFQENAGFQMKRNPFWYGWNDESNAGLYQTMAIRGVYVPDENKMLDLFLRGELDACDLNEEKTAQYAASDAIRYEEGNSVYAMVFNPDMEALKAAEKEAGANKNKTILTVKEFRMAMAFGMDRAGFALAASPESMPAMGLYTGKAVADAAQGLLYRATPGAKEAVLRFWGLDQEIGEGKAFATADEAYASIAGYDLKKAREYFNKAYEIALKKGLMDQDDVIEICIGTPNTNDSLYNKGYDFIVAQYAKVLKGTKLEGRLKFVREGNLGNQYAAALRANRVDMLFGVGWTAASLSPYGQFQVYVDARYQYDNCWDSKAAEVKVLLNGTEYTASAWQWFEAVAGRKVNVSVHGKAAEIALKTDGEKAIVLGALENAVLQNYHYIPLVQDADASLEGMQIAFETEENVYPLGNGGIKYMTYQYTDNEWALFVNQQGGKIAY